MRISKRINVWNDRLQDLADEFRQNHERSKVFVYDTTCIFNKVLDNPKEYGFADEAALGISGGIWCDFAHCGGAMHKIIAEDIALFLDAVAQ